MQRCVPNPSQGKIMELSHKIRRKGVSEDDQDTVKKTKSKKAF